MFEAVGRAMSRHPWWVVIAWVAFTVGTVLAAPRLSEVTNSDQSAFLPARAESVQAAQLARTAFPETSGATAVIVVKRADGTTLDDRDLATVGSLVQRLNLRAQGLDATRGVRFDPARSVAANRLVAIAVVQFAGSAERADVRAAVPALRNETTAALRGTGLTAAMTGEAAIVVDNKQAFGAAERVVTVTTLLLIVVLLLMIFRSPLAALLPLLSVGLVFGVSTSLVATAAKTLHFTVGQELPTMLTVVLFGIGTDYILFLLFRYRERLRAGDSPAEAIVAAVDRVGKAIFSAAFAVIAAFSALVLATLGFFTTLGPSLAIGVVVMLLAALTLVPAVLALLGDRVFWPVRRQGRSSGPTRLAAVGRLVSRRPRVVVAVTVVLLGGLAVAAFSVRADYDPIAQLPDGTEASRAYADLQRGFPPGALNPVHVYLRSRQPLTKTEIGEFVQKVSAVPGVAGPMEPRVAADGRTVDVPLVLAVPPYGGRALDLVSGPLRTAAWAAEPPDTEALLGGQTVAVADVRDATNRDLKLIFPVAALLFALILAVLLRTLLAPVYLVGVVVLGFAATLGATALVFQGLLGRSGLAFSIPIILYLFVTAIGTDYNILVSSRIREELREGRSPREAAALAIQHAGPSVAAAALILAGTFGSLVISGVPFFTEIGFAVTLGIVLVAFVISILLVPAAVATSRRSRRSGATNRAVERPLLLDRRA